jgi:hypothetical protein
VYAGVSKALIVSTCQPEPGLQIVAKCDAGSSGFPTYDHSRIDVGSQGVDCVEDRLRDSAGLIDDHQHVERVDALERSRVDRGNIHNQPATPLPHVRHSGSGKYERCSQVHSENPLPLL